MKIILLDTESHEHDETKYSPIGQMMAEIRPFLCLDIGKSQKRMKIEMNQAFWRIVKKAAFLARFVD